MGYLKSIKKYNPEYFVQPSQVKHFHTTLALWTAVSTTKLLLLSTVSQFVFGRAITSKLHQYNFKLHINSRDETVSVAMVMLDWEKKKKKITLQLLVMNCERKCKNEYMEEWKIQTMAPKT